MKRNKSDLKHFVCVFGVDCLFDWLVKSQEKALEKSGVFLWLVTDEVEPPIVSIDQAQQCIH